MRPRTTADNFWNYVDRSDGCWLWKRGRHRTGYGQLRFEGRDVMAHRVAYSLAVGDIPAGLHVLHRCDTPPCCRPDHLFVGTPADNARDRNQKGRAATGTRNGRYTHPERTCRGERKPSRKLTWAQVVDIRSRHEQDESLASLARAFGVAESTIRNIVHFLKWRVPA